MERQLCCVYFDCCRLWSLEKVDELLAPTFNGMMDYSGNINFFQPSFRQRPESSVDGKEPQWNVSLVCTS